MAQTQHGQDVYDHFSSNDADDFDFAIEWANFSFYMNTRRGVTSYFSDDYINYVAEWHKWCDEFAEWKGAE